MFERLGFTLLQHFGQQGLQKLCSSNCSSLTVSPSVKRYFPMFYLSIYFVQYLDLPLVNLISVEFFPSSVLPLLSLPLLCTTVLCYCLLSHISAALLMAGPPFKPSISFTATCRLCSRSIESLPDNQKYRQLQRELSQVLTQRQIFID